MRDIIGVDTTIEPESQWDALADSLAESMTLAWQRGERPLVEELFHRHPELENNAETAVRLIYEEIALRREYVSDPSEAEIYARFPRWRHELSILLACDKLVQPCDIATGETRIKVPKSWPEIGSRLGGFRLVSILGTGTMGRTFLALDPDLADRPVVLKITARGLGEHISLARLQHTNVVPLYAAPDFPEQDLRALCMPYLGGTSLDRIFTQIKLHVSGRPTGGAIIEAVDRASAQVSVEVRKQGAGRRVLEHLSYPDAIAWIASQIADALADAHERGLVHMDVKSANVLIAADGTPMLLDFHLAREPVRPEAIAPTWVGGTPHVMPPEQRAAMTAVREHRPVKVAVDGRADIYSLGRLMQEAFAVPRGNEEVTAGLNAIISRCVEEEPNARYANATSLAQDLRLHLSDEPLVGVRNHSLTERWRKWRRRSPSGLTQATAILCVMAVLLGVAYYAALRLTAAHQLFTEASAYFQNRNYKDAIRATNEGLDAAWEWPTGDSIKQSLRELRRSARDENAVRELHALADQLRYMIGVEGAASGDSRPTSLIKFREVWEKNKYLVESGRFLREREISKQVEEDLRDLVTLGPSLNISRAPTPEAKKAARLEANALLRAAEAVLKPAQANSAAMHYAEGVAKFDANDLPGALKSFDVALELQPNHFLSNFRHGLTSFRLQRYQNALADFHACIALAPQSADCFYNRAIVFSALHDTDSALRDYQSALKIRKDFFDAALNAGQIHYQLDQLEAAKTLLTRAIEINPTSQQAQYNLALVSLKQGDRAGALSRLDEVRALPQAVELKNRLMGER